MSFNVRRLVSAAFLAATLAVSFADSAGAAPPQPVDPSTAHIPAADSCRDFGLMITATAGQMRSKTFTDSAGNPVRLIKVGTGISYRYTNDATGKSITTRAGGSAEWTVYNSDQTHTVTATGHYALIMFAADIPGPSATAYAGRIVYNVDETTGVFTLVSTAGKSLDICAALT